MRILLEKGLEIDADIELFRSVELILAITAAGDPERMQKVYEHLYWNESLRDAFIKHGSSVEIEDKSNSDQIYIKGIVEGIRVCQIFFEFYSKTEPLFEGGKNK